MGSGNVKNLNTPKGHLLADEVNVELDVLSVLVMNRIGGEVNSRDVVAVEDRGLRDVAKQLLEQLTKPGALGGCIRQSPVLHLGTRTVVV